MYIHVNGARLYFDVEGAGLVPDGPRMREKRRFSCLHGGPGFDHTMFKPAFSALADIAQIILLRPPVARDAAWPRDTLTSRNGRRP